jgi:hypothetical protein
LPLEQCELRAKDASWWKRWNEERHGDQVGNGAEDSRRLILGDRKDEMLGEVTHDRALEESRSSLEIDHQ